MGLLEEIIRGSGQSGSGGLGDILGRMGQDGQQTASGSVLEEIRRRMGGGDAPSASSPAPTGGTSAPAGSDISVEDLERQMGIGRNRGQQQQPQQQYPQQQFPQQQFPQQQPQQQPQQYPQQQPYQPPQPQPQPSRDPEQPAQQQSSGGGLMSILKIIGLGAIAMMVLKKFRK